MIRTKSGFSQNQSKAVSRTNSIWSQGSWPCASPAASMRTIQSDSEVSKTSR